MSQTFSSLLGLSTYSLLSLLLSGKNGLILALHSNAGGWPLHSAPQISLMLQSHFLRDLWLLSNRCVLSSVLWPLPLPPPPRLVSGSSISCLKCLSLLLAMHIVGSRPLVKLLKFPSDTHGTQWDTKTHTDKHTYNCPCYSPVSTIFSPSSTLTLYFLYILFIQLS